MKGYLARIWSFSMLLVITISSSGFDMNQHLCGGKVKSKAIILHADKCDFEKAPLCQNKNHESSINRTPCCQDQHSFLKQVLDTEIITIDFQPFDYMAYISPTTWNSLIKENYTTPSFNHYRPPPLIKDIAILHQIFLL